MRSQLSGFLIMVVAMLTVGSVFCPIEAGKHEWKFASIPSDTSETTQETAEVDYSEIQDQLTAAAPAGVERFVYLVKFSGVDTMGQAVWGQMSCVAIAPNQFATAAHYMDGFSRLDVLQVVIDDEPHRVSRHMRDEANDFAVLTVDGVSVDFVEFRKPEYMEELTAYGMRSRELKTARCTDLYLKMTSGKLADASMSYLPGEEGFLQGDSGGGVFSLEDGKLVGIIRGRNSEGYPVGRFTPIEPLRDKIAGVSQLAKPSSSPQIVNGPAKVYSQPNCANGQCYQQPVYQPSRRGLFGWRRSR